MKRELNKYMGNQTARMGEFKDDDEDEKTIDPFDLP
jgi:hypothetical protein